MVATRNNDNQKKDMTFDIQFLDDVRSIKYSRNGNFLVCLIFEKIQDRVLGGEKFSLVIYDIKNNCENNRISLKAEPTNYICFDHEGVNYIVVLFDTSVFLWNLDTRQECGDIKINVSGSLVTGINSFALSQDGIFIGFTATDKTNSLSNATFTRIFNIKEGTKVYEKKHGYTSNTAESICFSPDSNYAVVGLGGSTEGLIFEILRKTEDNKFILEETLQTAIGGVHSIKFHPDGKNIYSVEKVGCRIVERQKFTHMGDIVIYDFKNKKLNKFLSPNETNQGAQDMELNARGTLFLTKSNQGFKIFDNETGKLILDISKTIDNPQKGIRVVDASINPFADYVAVCLNDNTVKNIGLGSKSQDVLFEVEQGEDTPHEGYIMFLNKGSKEYKPKGCMYKSLGCLSIIAFIIGSLLFVEKFIPYEYGNAVFIGIMIIAIGVMFYNTHIKGSTF